MDPENFLKKVNNPNFIPGIYNYCDRWCERCTFTSRCANRELTAEHENDPGKLDISNEKYWKNLENVFADTIRLLHHVAEKEGINLNIIDIEETEKEKYERREVKKKAENNLVSIQAKEYISIADAFLNDEKIFLQQQENDMNNLLHLGISGSKINKEAEEIKDIFEIIGWYKHQVFVKMMRALTASEEDKNWEDENGFQRDSDGSAKVALTGIDRSISAWGRLQQLFPEKTDQLITILFHLDTLRKNIENEFPQARKFIRAGFDD